VKSGRLAGILPALEEFLGALPALEPEEVKAYLKRLVPEYMPGGPSQGVILHREKEPG